MTHGHDHHHAGDGPVVVDIGDDVGALVLYTPEEMAGAEIEISALGAGRDGAHVAVHARQAGGREVHAAVYPALRRGSYLLWRPDGRPTRPVEVAGGTITEARWAEITQ